MQLLDPSTIRELSEELNDFTSEDCPDPIRSSLDFMCDQITEQVETIGSDESDRQLANAFLELVDFLEREESNGLPDHLPASDGWILLEMEMKDSARVSIQEIKMNLVPYGEIAEFSQRGKIVRVIFRNA